MDTTLVQPTGPGDSVERTVPHVAKSVTEWRDKMLARQVLRGTIGHIDRIQMPGPCNWPWLLARWAIAALLLAKLAPLILLLVMATLLLALPSLRWTTARQLLRLLLGAPRPTHLVHILRIEMPAGAPGNVPRGEMTPAIDGDMQGIELNVALKAGWTPAKRETCRRQARLEGHIMGVTPAVGDVVDLRGRYWHGVFIAQRGRDETQGGTLMLRRGLARPFVEVGSALLMAGVAIALCGLPLGLPVTVILWAFCVIAWRW